MHNIRTWSIVSLVILVIAGLSLFPPEEKLRKGRDLAGGVSLVYQVELEAGENSEQVIDSVIEVLKERVDPDGLAEISFVRQGRERIEVSMPLPTEDVKRLRAEYEEKLAELEEDAISEGELERVMRMDPQRRSERIAEMAGDNERRLEFLRNAADRFDEATLARENYEQAASQEEPDEEFLSDLLEAAAEAELAYEEAKEEVLQSTVSPEALDRALQLSDRERRILDEETDRMTPIPSPQQIAIENLKQRHPEAVEQIDEVIAAHERYTANRRGLDDVQDLKRLLRGSGVLNFRIAVSPGDYPEEQRVRRELQEGGPRSVRASDVRWFEIHDISTWFDSVQQYEFLQQNPAAFFNSRGLIGEEYNGKHYVLLWDTDELAMTQADGDWRVTNAFQSPDQLGRPAVSFVMDPVGARLLSELTGANLQKQMAVVLDDKVYTAPTLQGRISRNGQITGSYSQDDLAYLIRTLNAGALQAKLAPEPISQVVIGPSLGADNLRKGFQASVIALIMVAVFMTAYYFGAGAIAVVALACNALLILGAMSLNRAAFTLPGIAGIILTFGMAVDANVLIYERIREELNAGADLKTAVRHGYQKVLSTIIDANVTNLIICFVLYYTATQEIRGFAITLGVGIVATLFSTLVITRIIFSLLVDHVGLRRMPQLPTALPVIDRALTPKINWLKLQPLFLIVSTCFVGLGIAMISIQGSKMLDKQFLGGVSVTIELKDGETRTREDIAGQISSFVSERDPSSGDPLADLRTAEVLPLSPEPDGVTSHQFRIQAVADDPDVISNAIIQALSDLIDTRPPLTFQGAFIEGASDAPVYRVLGGPLGESIDRPQVRNDVEEFVGGVAIVVEDLEPRPSVEDLETRLRQMRNQGDFADTGGRPMKILVIEGSQNEVQSAVILVIDNNVTFFDNDQRWQTDVADVEWRLVREALTTSTTLAGVQSFSPAIAASFRAQAIAAILLSFLGILIYIWVRFGSPRYSLAAVAALLHDVLAVVGLIAFAEIIYEHARPVAMQLMIEPFKIDLGLIAALLTIIGYSLNDTIVILDRIRENRGKLAYASAEVINRSINQCISRTLITSVTTLLAVGIMYVIGGEGIRSFTYALLCGVLIGTYSSVAVAAPLVYSRTSSREPMRDELTEPAKWDDDAR